MDGKGFDSDWPAQMGGRLCASPGATCGGPMFFLSTPYGVVAGFACLEKFTLSGV